VQETREHVHRTFGYIPVRKHVTPPFHVRSPSLVPISCCVADGYLQRNVTAITDLGGSGEPMVMARGKEVAAYVVRPYSLCLVSALSLSLCLSGCVRR
jgi:hypothetical protein